MPKIEPRVGGAFQIYIDPRRAARQEGRRRHALHGAAAEEDAVVRLERAAALPEARAQRTFVVVRFEPVTDKQTRVTLHHTGGATAANGTRPTPISTRRGAACSANLKKRFDQGPQDWTEWLAQLKKWRSEEAAAQSAPK